MSAAARILTGSALAGGLVGAWTFLPASVFVSLLFLVLGYILLKEWPAFQCGWLTLWYPVTPFLALIDLYLVDAYLWLWVVAVVATYDTVAYVVGARYGQVKIAPALSAGKTVEGTLVGIGAAGIMGIFACSVLQKSLYSGILYACFAGIFVAVLAFWGDLFESYLKRQAGLKDSGSLLPGHGGVLDRIDGLLCAAMMIDILIRFWS